jgi:hypothetical protein
MTEEEAGLDPKCARCGRSVPLGRGECYLVDVRVVADPTPPVFTGDDLSVDAAREIDRLLKSLRKLSRDELLAQVYRRRLFCLCCGCYAEWSADPFGRST